MKHEYNFQSMVRPTWVPCEFICLNTVTNEAVIKYYDPFMAGVVEVAVPPEFVRPATITTIDQPLIPRCLD